jgi:hypothetical protein
MSLALTQTIGTATVDVTSAGLPGASPGIALRFELYDGPIAFTLTDDEAGWLLAQIETRLAP